MGTRDSFIMFSACGHQTLIGAAMALKGGPHRQAASHYRAVVALCLRGVSIQPPVIPPAIGELYNLTPREMTTLATLIESAGVKDFGDVVMLSAGTIKCHQKSNFRATGAAASPIL
jgi:hypothetical protein